MTQPTRRAVLGLVLLPLAACGGGREGAQVATMSARAQLNPGETPAMRRRVNRWADRHGVPRALFHRVIQRESDYRADALNPAGPYYGLMQILPATARSMGHRGPARTLLDPEVNLKYAGRYLRGAWLVSGGDMDAAVMWYARGYYYEAKRLGLLEETGLG